ncbi:hypothetical protein CMI37_28010 [Candidatus Pacearchaeota archaeon]|jgi:hypothetical protein|nr:hypothetical protein [Candidatus Pacearchaeota archaeon]|tara:strand:+ start:4213 stop:4596 length:384 start_codon:yes stop_codon:yes gene_type:complete
MQVGLGSDDRRLDLLCERVQRLLRASLSDWYGYLSRESLTDWKWRYEVPWWAKKVPERFDKDWALNDLRTALDRPGMLASLVMAVDETILSLKRDGEKLSNPPKLDVLNAALDELCAEVGGYDVLGV